MSIRKAIIEDVDAFVGGRASLATALGMASVNAFNNRLYELKGQKFDFDTPLVIQQLSGTNNYARAVAAESGGVFVPLPHVEIDDRQDLMCKFLELTAELGELSGDFNKFTGKGELTDAECEVLHQVGQKVHRTLEELLGLGMRVYRRSPPAAAPRERLAKAVA
jgi:hypothetical protein